MLEINLKEYIRADFKCVPWLLPGISRPRRDVKHSPLSTAEAENKWSFTSTSLLYLNGMNETNLPLHQCGTDRQESLVFYSIGPK